MLFYNHSKVIVINDSEYITNIFGTHLHGSSHGKVRRRVGWMDIGFERSITDTVLNSLVKKQKLFSDTLYVIKFLW